MSRRTVEADLREIREAEKDHRFIGSLTFALSGILGILSANEIYTRDITSASIVAGAAVISGGVSVYNFSAARSDSLAATAQESLVAQERATISVEAEEAIDHGILKPLDPLR